MSNRRLSIVIVAALVPAALVACGSETPKPTTSSAGASAPAPAGPVSAIAVADVQPAPAAEQKVAVETAESKA